MELRYIVHSRFLLMAMIGSVMTCCSFLIFVYDPLQIVIKKLVYLSPGSFYKSLWSNPPFEILVDIYIFNVTNPQEFLDGKEKLTFNQVGPYVYKEILKNQNAVFNDNGTLTFTPKRYLEFVREKSIGDLTEDRIITPNIPLIGITSSLQDASMFTNLAVTTISNFLGSKSFLNVTIHEYLWGYDDRLVTLANEAIPSWINFEKFGILDRLMALDNASNIVTLNLHPELGTASHILKEKERKQTYHIHRWNGSPGLKQWGYVEQENNETIETNTRCNMVEGSFEGTIFPPNMDEDVTYKMYRRAFCRPIPMDYESKGYTKDGFYGFNFRVDQKFLSRPEINPDNDCYCYKGRCLLNGLGSLAPCYYDIPIVISQPHFLNADPILLEQVHGLVPNKSIHDSILTLHPNLSIPLSGNLRMQINLDVGETKYNSRTKPFNGLILPMFWLEMKMASIPTIIYFLITLLYHVLPVVQDVLIYLLGIFGIALISGSTLSFVLVSRRQSTDTMNFKNEYSPIPLLPFTSQYFKPEIRISK